MKKGMLVMTILVVLAFLVSVIAVAPSFTKQVTQPKGSTTSPTTSQQGTVPVPAAQTQQATKPKETMSQIRHDKFWALECDHCIIGGVDSRGKDYSGNLSIKDAKVGQSLTSTCFYKVKTPPVNDITEVDAKFWGTGTSYCIAAQFTAKGGGLVLFEKKENRNLPYFTWEDVKHWKRAGKGSDPKIWTEHMMFTWTPTSDRPWFYFCVDSNKVIAEYDGRDNNCQILALGIGF